MTDIHIVQVSERFMDWIETRMPASWVFASDNGGAVLVPDVDDHAPSFYELSDRMVEEGLPGPVSGDYYHLTN